MKLKRRIGVGLAAAVTAVAALCVAYVVSLGPVPTGANLELSKVVLDRDGRLLRAYATSEGRWRLPAKVEDVDPRFLKLLFAYEDKRFYHHVGVDPLALVRAAWQLVDNREIISGGSTLTMQVARLLEPRRERSMGAELHQIVRALELEWSLSPRQILSL
jgi:penicillin-binding protein 1C